VRFSEAPGEAVGLGVDDEIDVALAKERHVARAMPRDGGKAHLLEQRVELFGLGRCVLDELEPVSAHRVGVRNYGPRRAMGKGSHCQTPPKNCRRGEDLPAEINVSGAPLFEATYDHRSGAGSPKPMKRAAPGTTESGSALICGGGRDLCKVAETRATGASLRNRTARPRPVRYSARDGHCGQASVSPSVPRPAPQKRPVSGFRRASRLPNWKIKQGPPQIPSSVRLTGVDAVTRLMSSSSRLRFRVRNYAMLSGRKRPQACLCHARLPKKPGLQISACVPASQLENKARSTANSPSTVRLTGGPTRVTRLANSSTRLRFAQRRGC
jgi:hypothetical protein